MILRALCIVLFLGARVAGDDLASGVYEIGFEEPGKAVDRGDGADGTVFLRERLTDKFGKAKLVSRRNDNSQFVLNLTGAGPFPKGAEAKRFAVVVAGKCFPVGSNTDPTPQGTLDLGATVGGLETARKVADELGVAAVVRSHPGHRLVVTFEPEKARYAPGEAVVLVMTIRNVGDAPVSFADGGMQRGPRNNQFGFTAFRSNGHGKPVPDAGEPRNFGGLVGRPTIKPGEAFTKRVELGKWFEFDEADSYRITGLYRMAIADADLAAPALWDDFAVAECTVYVAE